MTPISHKLKSSYFDTIKSLNPMYEKNNKEKWTKTKTSQYYLQYKKYYIVLHSNISIDQHITLVLSPG